MQQKVYTKYFDSFLVTLFLLVGFVPYFDAIDKIAPQYLYLTLINLISSFYVLLTFEKVKFRYGTYVLFSLLAFSIWSFLSIIYAINVSEVLIENSRIVNFLFAFTNIYLLVNRNQHYLKYVPFLISVILIIEVSLVYERFFERYSGDLYSRDMGLRAFSGNINITAFNFLLKFPFLINVLSRLKINFIIKIITISIFVFCLFLLGSRGANLFFIVTVIISFLTILFLKGQTFLTKKDVIILLISLVIGGSTNYFLFKKNETLNFIQRSTNLDTSSTQQRLRFYKAAINSTIANPFFGVGLGNWKIHATKFDKPYMIDYTVPYHVHNDFLELTAEMGIVGALLYFGIFFWIFYLIFNTIKSKIYKSNGVFYIIIIGFMSCLVYLADSFLNFPFTRPLIQIQNIFYWVIILAALNTQFNLTKNYSLEIYQQTKYRKLIISLIIISGLSYCGFISYKVYNSFVEQQFLTAAGNGSFSNYSRQYVESIKSDIPSIDATTVPIETKKANLIYNLSEYEIADDTLHYMIEQGRKQNPFLPYNDLTKSVLFIKQRKPDSAYFYSKKAFYEIPNNKIHFNLLMDIAEAYKDSLEVNKAMNSIKVDIRDEFYEKYLQVSLNIKNNIGLTESKFLEKYNSKSPDNETAKVFNIIFEVGKKNVEDGYLESLKGINYFNKKDFLKSAESFSKALRFNPLEVSYYENAANSYMQAGEDDKAIKTLNSLLKKLNPKTGKAEYLLAIIYIADKNYNKGCNNLSISRLKGFNIPDIMFKKFCDLDSKK